MTASIPETIFIGCGVTEQIGSDRRAYSIVEIVNDRTIVIQEDNAVRTDDNGMSETQRYDYTPNPQGEKHTLTLRKNGRWKRRGFPMDGPYLYTIGKRKAYYDYSR